MQTVGVTALAVVLRTAGLAGLGWFSVAFSAGLVVFYLGIEALGALVPKIPAGDVRGMISISPLPAVGLLAAIIVVHGILLFSSRLSG